MSIYLPSIHGGAPTPIQPPDPIDAFVDAWMHLLGSHAALMRRDDRLTHCAMQHADFLAHRTPEQEQYSMHIGIGLSYPNQRVLWAGYRLPDYFRPDRNNVESCARNPADPAAVIISLANHDTHYNHLHCIRGFESHVFWGVGHAKYDWVVVTCPPENG